MSIHVTKLADWPYEDDQSEIAKAYNHAGERYRRYADGSLSKLFVFDSRYAYGDRQTWAVIESCLHRMRMSGMRRLRLLDLGCGPGTWLRRTVTRARQMGFTEIIARGVDLSDSQIRWARMLSDPLNAAKGITLTYDVGDIADCIPETDNNIDLCLCLYGVLNHVFAEDLPRLLKRIAHATTQSFVATVRTIGSTPTIYVDGIAAARNFRQDNERGRLDVEFQNGSKASFNSRLFNHEEIKSLVTACMELEDLRGLDLFHGRFASDPRWNPPTAEFSQHFKQELEALETRYSHDPGFMDHATHLLLLARPLAQPLSDSPR